MPGGSIPNMTGEELFLKTGSKERSERDQVLLVLKREGLSVRQIARLTGLNRGIVPELTEFFA